MDYHYERPVSRARGRLVASRQAFFEQASSPVQKKENSRPLTSLVDEKLEMFTKSTQEATRNLAKSTPDLTALEQDANIRVSQHLSKSRSNLNQTFDSSMFRGSKAVVDEVDNSYRPTSPNKSFSSYFTAKKPPLPPKKPSSPPPPAPSSLREVKAAAYSAPPPPVSSTPTYSMLSSSRGTPVAANPTAPVTSVASSAAAAPSGKMSEFDRIVNSIKSTDTYKRYKNHPAMSQPDLRRRSKSLGFLELDEEDNWVLPTKPLVEPVFPELSERSVSTTHLAKKTATPNVGAANTSSDDEASDYEDVPIPCNRLTAAKSEFELRVEKSLKNLNVPEWYTKSSRPSSRASILSGRNTPAMSSERFTRNRPDYESFRSAYSVSSSTTTPKRETASRTTTPSWRSFSRRSPPTPSSESEHQSMEKTQNWINSQHSVLSSSSTTTTTTASTREPYTGWRRAKDLSDTEFSSSFEEKRSGSERFSFVQAVNNSVLSEDRSYMETSFDSTPTTEYHNKVWIESSLISRPAVNGYQRTDYQETYKEQSYPGYKSEYGVYEKRQSRHPDVIYNKEKPPRPSTRNPFSGGLLEAVV